MFLVAALISSVFLSPVQVKWPANLDWTTVHFRPDHPVWTAEPHAVELQDSRSTGDLRADELHVYAEIDDFEISNQPDHFRIARFSTVANPVTHKVAFTSEPVPPLNVRPIYGTTNEVAIEVSRDFVASKPTDRIAVFALATRNGSTFWVAFARSEKAPPSLGTSVNKPTVVPSVSPSQSLLDGRKEFVGRLALKTGLRDLFPNTGGTWGDLVFSGVASTERLDPGASGSLELQVGRKYGPHGLSQFGLHTGIKGDQSGRAFATYANIGLSQFIPATTLHEKSNIIETDDFAELNLYAAAERRWRREDDISPYHISPSVAYFKAELQAGPIWLAPKRPGAGSFGSDLAITTDLRGYYFPDDMSEAGFGARPFESYAEIDLSVPFKIWVGYPVLYYKTGALEGEQFTRSVQWGVGFNLRF